MFSGGHFAVRTDPVEVIVVFVQVLSQMFDSLIARFRSWAVGKDTYIRRKITKDMRSVAYQRQSINDTVKNLLPTSTLNVVRGHGDTAYGAENLFSLDDGSVREIGVGEIKVVALCR
jgi:hypothetical protein